MSLYLSKTPGSPFSSVEFRARPEGNFTVFHLKKNAHDANEVISHLSADWGQKVVGDTSESGERILITRGSLSQKEVLGKLKAEQGVFEKFVEKRPFFQPWKWRGGLSFLGQGLNLYSSLSKGERDIPKLIFAALNIAANCVNLAFGGQKLEDEHQLYQAKVDFHESLQRFLPEGQALPDPSEVRAPLRQEEKAPLTWGEKFNGFMRKNSVRVGEIGLRYFGAITMAFPVVFGKKGEGKPFTIARNKNDTNFYTGIAYLVGKTIGLFSKVPDPYNPKPHTLIDTIREKWLFRLSTAIETGAATTLAYGNFKVNPKTGKNDVVGGMGGVALMGGLTTRLFAEFGTRVLNRQELYDDLVDCFARVLPENLQQAVADTAAKLHKHYDKKSPGVAQIYERLATQLYHDYAIAVLPEEASTRTAAAPVIEANAVKRFADRSREHFNHTQRTIANANRALLQPAL